MATYTIDSVQDLIDLTLLTGKFEGATYKDNLFNLTVDLDLTDVDPLDDSTGWLPIANGDYFNGYFDGKGHTISNMTISRAGGSSGLFGALDGNYDGATYANNPIKNLGLIDVNITGAARAGGMFADTFGPGLRSEGIFPIKNCYVTGTIATSRIGGGFAGGSNNGYFLDCWCDVDVTVTTVGPGHYAEVGGFLGFDSPNTDCVNCYSLGAVVHANPLDATEDTELGGFVGQADDDYATSSYWNTETSLQAADGVNGDAVGKTTAEMKLEVTYTGWDFNDTWWMTAGETYPALQVFGGMPEEPEEPDESLAVSLLSGKLIRTGRLFSEKIR